MKHTKVLLLIMVLVLTCVFALPFSANVAKAKDKTLVAGYLDDEGYIYKNKDGQYEGYGVDYLNEISRYTGFKYKYKSDSRCFYRGYCKSNFCRNE